MFGKKSLCGVQSAATSPCHISPVNGVSRKLTVYTKLLHFKNILQGKVTKMFCTNTLHS